MSRERNQLAEAGIRSLGAGIRRTWRETAERGLETDGGLAGRRGRAARTPGPARAPGARSAPRGRSPGGWQRATSPAAQYASQPSPSVRSRPAGPASHAVAGVVPVAVRTRSAGSSVPSSRCTERTAPPRAPGDSARRPPCSATPRAAWAWARSAPRHGPSVCSIGVDAGPTSATSFPNSQMVAASSLPRAPFPTIALAGGAALLVIHGDLDGGSFAGRPSQPNRSGSSLGPVMPTAGRHVTSPASVGAASFVARAGSASASSIRASGAPRQ